MQAMTADKQNRAGKAKASPDSARTKTPVDSDLVLLGVVGRPKGVRGQVWVYSYTDSPADIASYGVVRDTSGHNFSISVSEVKGRQVVAQLSGITDRSAAESLNGVKLYIPRAQLPQLEEDRYYLADLIGLAAVDESGKAIGKVVDVYNYGAGDVIEIARGKDEPLCLLFRNEYVPDVDISAKRITVRIPDETIATAENGEEE